MRRSIAAALALAITLAALSAGEAFGGDKADTPAETVRQLMSEGRYDACLARINAWHDGLPEERRLRAWEIDFMGSEVPWAAVGKDHLYFVYHVSNSRKDAPGMKTTLPFVEPSQGSDWRHVVVCVDIGTGAIRWSRPCRGPQRMVIDPATDTLYLFGSTAMVALTSDGADPMMRPWTDKRQAVGLLTSQGIRVSSAHGLRDNWNRKTVCLYCPRTRSLVEVNLKQQLTLSRDESKRLIVGTGNYHGFNNHFTCQTLNGNQLWSYSAEGLRSPCLPRWHEGDVIWLRGSCPQKGEAVRLDGQSGKVLWRTVLPNGAYKPSDVQLIGGSYGFDDWDSLMVMKDGKSLLAVGGTARLFVLDGQTGRIMRSARPSATLLAPPTWTGGRVIVCSYGKVMAIPEVMLFRDAASPADERDVLVAKARCLKALGRLDEALKVTTWLLACDEDWADAWQVRAEIAGAKKDELEEAYCLCRHAQLTGRALPADVRNRWGLVRMIPLGSRPSWHLAATGQGPIYAGTQRGDVWAIQGDSLEARVVEERQKEVYGLAVDTRLRYHALTGSFVVGNGPPGNWLQPVEAPASWFTVTGGDGPVVAYRGKRYRPLKGGKVRILDDNTVVERVSPLDGIGAWQIHVTPAGPMGWDRRGLYTLDEDLCPVKQLIAPQIEGVKPDNVTMFRVASVGDSIAVIAMASGSGTWLQIYDRRDGALRREINLGPRLSGSSVTNLLTPLGNGYLVSDRQLVWAAGAGKGLWRFGPPLERTVRRDRRGWQKHFGEPLVRDGRLLVTSADGCIYAFDTGHILAAGAEKSRSATQAE